MAHRGDLKRFLLHERRSVREFVAEYFEDSWDEGEDLLPLVLEACERYGDAANSLVLVRASRFQMNGETFTGLLKRLNKAEDENIVYNLNYTIVHAPVALLKTHEAEVLRSANLHIEYAGRIRRRCYLHDRSSEELWATLRQLSREWKEAEEDKRLDHTYSHDLVEELATRDTPDTRMICDLLTSPEVMEEWLEVFLIELAGARRIHEAVPLLVEKFRIDEDAVLEGAMLALARIGDPEAVRLIRETFGRENWDFRLFTSDVLGKIKHPESEDAIVALLTEEEDETIRTYLCLGLCQLFSDRAIETVKKEIAFGYDRGTASLEDALLDVADVLGVSLPEEQTWRAERAERERRVAARMAETEEWGRRRAELEDQGFEPFEEYDDDFEDDLDDETDEDYEDEADSYTPFRHDTDEDDVPFRRTARKIGRNEPCPCGSGKKYKKCCGKRS